MLGEAGSDAPKDSPHAVDPGPRVLQPLTPDDPVEVGPYRLVGRLGSDGVGTVFAGVDRSGRPVAVKMIHPDLARDGRFRARFAREIRLLQEMQGVSTVRVLAADPEAARPWLATEYLAPPGLAEHGAPGGAPASAEKTTPAAGSGENSGRYRDDDAEPTAEDYVQALLVFLAAAAEAAADPERPGSPAARTSGTPRSEGVPERRTETTLVPAGHVTRLPDRPRTLLPQREQSPPRSRRDLWLYGVAIGMAALVVGIGLVKAATEPGDSPAPNAMTATADTPTPSRAATATPSASRTASPARSPSATPSAGASGTPTRTPEGATFLRPAKWKVTVSGPDALHPSVCVRPAGRKSCAKGGIEILHDYTDHGTAGLDGGLSLPPAFGCRGGEAHLLRKTVERLRDQSVEHRRHLIQCTDDVQFEAQTWYLSESSTLIRASRVPRAAVDLVLESFRFPAGEREAAESAPVSSARAQALAMDAFLEASAKTNAKLRKAVDLVRRCRDLDEAIAALDEVWAERSFQVREVQDTLSDRLAVDALEGGDAMMFNLREAMEYSLRASGEYSQWAERFRAGNCVGGVGSQYHLEAAEAASARAEKAKRFFVRQWNRIAKKEGLATRKASEI